MAGGEGVVCIDSLDCAGVSGCESCRMRNSRIRCVSQGSMGELAAGLFGRRGLCDGIEQESRCKSASKAAFRASGI